MEWMTQAPLSHEVDERAKGKSWSEKGQAKVSHDVLKDR